MPPNFKTLDVRDILVETFVGNNSDLIRRFINSHTKCIIMRWGRGEGEGEENSNRNKSRLIT